MTRTIVLDSGPLSLVAHNVGFPEGDACRAWAESHAATGVQFVIPEMADYEVRRELTRAGKTASLRRLDRFAAGPLQHYLPITTPAMRRATQLWADVRNRGLPTADPKELDGDVIIAAQVLTSIYAGPNVVVATTNVSHLGRLLAARDWRAI